LLRRGCGALPFGLIQRKGPEQPANSPSCGVT
jgi:hypothetical protein